MCNSYRIQPKRGADKGIAKRIAEVAERLKSDLVRKSNPGVVMRADGRVELMRWGFHRSFNPSINNARSDNLESGMWAEAFHERRCVIPMSLFYEWGPHSPTQSHSTLAHSSPVSLHKQSPAFCQTSPPLVRRLSVCLFECIRQVESGTEPDM